MNDFEKCKKIINTLSSFFYLSPNPSPKREGLKLLLI
jgi:hypothetical protein